MHQLDARGPEAVERCDGATDLALPPEQAQVITSFPEGGIADREFPALLNGSEGEPLLLRAALLRRGLIRRFPEGRASRHSRLLLSEKGSRVRSRLVAIPDGPVDHLAGTQVATGPLGATQQVAPAGAVSQAIHAALPPAAAGYDSVEQVAARGGLVLTVASFLFVAGLVVTMGLVLGGLLTQQRAALLELTEAGIGVFGATLGFSLMLVVWSLVGQYMGVRRARRAAAAPRVSPGQWSVCQRSPYSPE